MKRNLWFRMYASILDLEDKTQELSDKLFRAWVRLLALYTRNNAVMPSDSAVARCLKVSVPRLAEIFQSLKDSELIQQVNGAWMPYNWDERQYESDSSTERVRLFRERHRSVSGNVTETFHETPSENREQKQRTEEHPLPPQGDVLVLAAPEPKQRVRKAKAEAIPESPEFVEFYRLYPRHVGRAMAWLAWQHHVHNGDAPKVIAGLKTALPALNRAEEDKRPYPATWLDQERWRDCEGLNGTTPKSIYRDHVAEPRPANAEMLKFEIPKGEK